MTITVVDQEIDVSIEESRVVVEVVDEDTLLLTVVEETVVAVRDEHVILITENIGIMGPQGVQGIQGIQGIQGPAGTDGGSYVHEQLLPSATWTITHNLGYYPGGIIVVDSSNRIVEGDITYASANQVVLTFNGSFSGVAYLS